MSGRLHAYVVAYDITDDRRRSKVADILLSHGARRRRSVFLSGATTASALRMKDEVRCVINSNLDSVIVCDLGMYDARESKCSYLGMHVRSGLDRGCMII